MHYSPYYLVSLGFFDTIHVSVTAMHNIVGAPQVYALYLHDNTPPTYYSLTHQSNQDTKEWYWDYEVQALNIPISNPLRFRVESVEFNPPTSSAPNDV